MRPVTTLFIIFTILILMPVPGIQGQVPDQAQPQVRYRLFRYSLEINGRVRTALVYLPPQYGPDRTLPVVLVFHPNGADARLMSEITQMHAYGDQAGFITVYPDAGSPSGQPGGRSWPVGSETMKEPMETAPGPMEDLVFIETLIDDLALEYTVDEQRIYAVGLGQGASMAARLACEMAGRLAAIALVSPGAPFNDCRPSNPVSVLVIQDRKSPRRHLPLADDPTPNPGRSDSMVDWWLRFNQCAPEAAPTLKTGDAECWTFRSCPQTGAVDYCRVKDAGQAWPGAGQLITDNPYADLPFSASYTIWRFLDLHARPLPTTPPPASNPPQTPAEDQETGQIDG